MGRRASIQVTATKGELDPDLSERLDMASYYDSVAVAKNTLFHPQGGFSDRGGFALASDADVLASGVERRLRRAVAPIPVDAANMTAINGGLSTSLADQSLSTLFTTNPVTSAAFVVVEVDLLSSQRVDLVDVMGYRCETGGADDALQVEYYEGEWKPFADAIGLPAGKNIRSAARTRRFGVTPGGIAGNPVIARHWRVIVRNASGIGAVSIAGLAFWRETSRLVPQRMVEVAREAGASYTLVVSERNVDVYDGQRYQASIPLDVAAQQVPQLAFAGGIDTLLVFHEMLETARIVRQGSAGEWDVGATPFTDVPTIIEGTTFWGDQDEIQDVLTGALSSAHSFVLMLGHMRTAAVAMSSGDLAAAIRAALVALPGLATAAADLVVTAVAGGHRIRFGGANGARAWPLINVIALDDAAPTVATRVAQQGLLRTGPLFGATTGWPRSGAFVQQRLLLAGFRGGPTSYRFSVAGDLWSFLGVGDTPTADRAFGGSLDVDDVEVINEVFVGRHLQLFTEAGEWYAEAIVLDATNPLAFRRATSHGIERGVSVVFADGATLFVQKGGRTLRDFIYTDVEQSYTADPLSVMAPHHMTGVVDMTARPARSVSEGNLVAMVNADGSIAAITLLRGQKVVASAPWSTPGGSFRAALATSTFDLFVISERAGDRWLEKWTPDAPLDFATRSVGAPRAIVSDAHHLEGRTDVWAIADDDVLGPFTVTNGQFVLPEAAEVIVYGLAPEWRVRSNVLRSELRNAQPFRAPARVYEVTISMRATGALTLSANWGPHHDVPLARTGYSLDWGGPQQTVDGGAPQLPLLQRLYTGDVVRTGLLGVSSHPAIELARSKPAPVHIKALRFEIAMKGGE